LYCIYHITHRKVYIVKQKQTMTSPSITIRNTPWVEKYRPKKLSEVSHQNEVVSTLQNAVSTNRLPHLLLYGPPGTGKTSVALALCKTLWSPEQLKRRVLELNASDERGISIVRDKIKHFASLAVGTHSSVTELKKKKKNFFGASNDNNDEKDANEDEEMEDQQEQQYPNPPFKIIILDEADTVTPDAQAALRRIIEAHSKITRFILICNYVTRIIEPLASRCAKFRFQPLPPASMKNRLIEISTMEQCRFSPRSNDDTEEEKEREYIIDEILDLSGGDMRRAVTTLQSTHLLSSNKGYIQKDTIAEMAGLPPPSIITSLLDILKHPKSTFDTMEREVKDIISEGYAAQHIMKALLIILIKLDSKELSESHKSSIAVKVAEVDKNLIDSADEQLQLLAVCSLILKCFHQ